MRLADVDVRLVHSTERAYLVQSVDTEIEVWVPKSRCELELTKGSDMGTLTLDQDYAEELRIV